MKIKIKLLLNAFLIISSLNIFSQNASWNYTVLDLPSNPVSMTNAVILGPGGDDITYNLAWPFAFSVYDDSYTTSDSIAMNSNGYIRFDNFLAAIARSGFIPTNNNLYGQFLSYGGNSDGYITNNIQYLVTGLAPNRILIIGFTYYTHYLVSPSVIHADIQISFYESNHNIKVDYSNISGTTISASYLGLNAGDGLFYNNKGTFPSTSIAYLYSPDSLSVVSPLAFSANAMNNNSIALNWMKNLQQDDVLLVVNTTNNFVSPTDSSIYQVGDTIGFGLGTVIYKGSSSSYLHSGLITNATYYYQLYSFNNFNSYSTPLFDFATVNTPVTLPAVVVSNGSASICPNDSVQLATIGGMFYTYQWYKNGTPINNANQVYLTVSDSGNYSVLVTDTLSQLDSLSNPLYISILSVSSPQLMIDTTYIACTNDSAIFSTSVSYASYLWSNGAATSQTYLSTSNYISVQVIDNNGCKLTSNSYYFNADSITPVSICAVSVNIISTQNIIIWDGSLPANIDSLILYREINSGNYQKVITVSATSNLSYHDFNVNPKIQNYRYKLQTKDSCGNLSALSPYHQTILLSINQMLIGNTLNWTPYIGTNIIGYNIYRGPDSNNFAVIDTVGANMNSYTDYLVPAGQNYYMVEAKFASSCGTSPLITSSSLSNYVKSTIIGIENVENNLFGVEIFPNPANSLIIIETKNNEIINKIKVYTTEGILVQEEKLSAPTVKINITSLKSGIYILMIETESGVSSKKFIKL